MTSKLFLLGSMAFMVFIVFASLSPEMEKVPVIWQGVIICAWFVVLFGIPERQ